MDGFSIDGGLRQLPRFCVAGTKLILAVALTLPLAGCRPAKLSPEQATDDPAQRQTASDSLSATAILDEMRRVYASTDSYRDQAVLTLRYQLQGRYLEEPHQWAVEFQRDNKLRCSVYNARLRSDGQRLGCFIYDFSSGNLDNQWQIQQVDSEKKLPLLALLEDKICRHYLTGQIDLPIAENKPAVAELFFPPTIGLLGGGTGICWLDGSDAARIPDRTVDGHLCRGVSVQFEGMPVDLMIDADCWLLREIRFPIQAMDRRLNDNPAVRNLQVFATFTGATTEPNFPDQHFSFELPNNAVPVREFVAVPEPFPSANIGQAVPRLGLLDNRGYVTDQSPWSGRVTLLAWTGEVPVARQWCSVIEQVARELPVADYHVAEVITIDDLVPGDSRLGDLLTREGRPAALIAYADPGFSAGQSLGLSTWPVLAVVDKNGILQYVQSVDDRVPEPQEILAVMARVREGDDVAAEIRREYEKFMNDYYTRLQSARLDQQP